ncbi:MAG: SMC-Scp complex subunit ScpB [Pseudomonadota bacterium]
MIEAILFAASEPLDIKTIAARLPQGVDVRALLDVLAAHYENRGVHVSEVAGKWRFATAPDVSHILETERIEPRRLSRAALETLAIIAYHQPCTRADIEDVRGVAVSKGSLDQLLEIGWVRLRGRRKDAPGRPVLYGTTQSFLEHFGLAGADDLPGLADLKAAGLLDARLPPGFSVPTPSAGDGEDEGEDEDGDGPDFAQDFMADGDDLAARAAHDDADGLREE